MQDRPSAVTDALEVVETYDHLTDTLVYLFRLHFLIERNRVMPF